MRITIWFRTSLVGEIDGSNEYCFRLCILVIAVDGQMNRWIDGWTDIRTDRPSHRAARTYLKIHGLMMIYPQLPPSCCNLCVLIALSMINPKYPYYCNCHNLTAFPVFWPYAPWFRCNLSDFSSTASMFSCFCHFSKTSVSKKSNILTCFAQSSTMRGNKGYFLGGEQVKNQEVSKVQKWPL